MARKKSKRNRASTLRKLQYGGNTNSFYNDLFKTEQQSGFQGNFGNYGFDNQQYNFNDNFSLGQNQYGSQGHYANIGNNIKFQNEQQYGTGLSSANKDLGLEGGEEGGGFGNFALDNAGSIAIAAQLAGSLTEGIGQDPWEAQYFEGNTSTGNTLNAAATTLGGPIASAGQGLGETIGNLSKSGLDIDEYGVAQNEGQMLAYGIGSGGADLLGQVGREIDDDNWGGAALSLVAPMVGSVTDTYQEQRANKLAGNLAYGQERTQESLKEAGERGANLGTNAAVGVKPLYDLGSSGDLNWWQQSVKGVSDWAGMGKTDEELLKDYHGISTKYGGQLPQAQNGGDIKFEDTEYGKAWNAYPGEQAKLNAFFQQKNPTIPLDQILQGSLESQDFSNQNLQQLAQPLITQYGDMSISPEQVDSISSDFYKYQNIIRRGPGEQGISTVGTGAEESLQKPAYGFQSILERRTPYGQTPYSPYLESLPARQNGGDIINSYTGQTHDGENGGIPVDSQGIPSAQSYRESVALTEAGEISWNSYIFSNAF